MREQHVSVKEVRAMYQRGPRVILLLLLCVVVWACANSGDNPADGGTPDAKAIGPCGPGTAVMCGDTCVDTQSNFQNCGSCGNACPNDQVCSHGACAVVCGGGTARCGNDCVDLNSDVNNCGSCAKPCPSGNVCSKGTCAVTCQPGLTDCNGDCVDVNQNDDNCGACGSACGGGQVCSAGKCIATCQSGFKSCTVGDAGATQCVDTQLDNANCGNCNAPCPGGEVCSNGTCGLTCNGGTSKCSNACVDESIDPGNCGACGSTCAGNCSSGHCCAANQVYCGSCDTVANCILKNGGQIAAGGSHTCAITLGGALKCWGDDFFGEIGDGQDINNSLTPYTLAIQNPTYVGLGEDFSCAVTAAGGAYCWGDGFEGQLGNGIEDEQTSPVQVPGVNNAVRIDGGYDQTCVQLGSGQLLCFGGNTYGEVGNGDNSQANQDQPFSVIGSGVASTSAGTGNTTCVSLTDGTARCWGEGDTGQIGDGAELQNNVSPVTVLKAASTTLTNVKSVAVGGIHSCAVLNDGTVWCWGDDTFSELGDGKAVEQDYPIQAAKGVISTATAVAAGGDAFGDYAHTCVLTSAGAVYCWGSNDYGQIGNGNTTTPVTTPYEVFTSGVVGIAAGEIHTCAYKSDGTVWCWGYNGSGQLGIGNTKNKSSPVQVTTF
ncbi:MAG TPA: hypothetical protein VGH28_24845 [Polyangiaceae bacterium]|jgi:alpha-tubulin suppressor-like RCC1 family protein